MDDNPEPADPPLPGCGADSVVGAGVGSVLVPLAVDVLAELVSVGDKELVVTPDPEGCSDVPPGGSVSTRPLTTEELSAWSDSVPAATIDAALRIVAPSTAESATRKVIST